MVKISASDPRTTHPSPFDPRETGAPLDYLAPLLSNLSQLPACRAELLQPAVLPRLLPFLSYHQSIVRRGGAIGAVRYVSELWMCVFWWWN